MGTKRIVKFLSLINRYFGCMPRRSAGLNPRRSDVPLNRKPEDRTEREYVIGGNRVMARSRKDAIKRLKHRR